MATSSESVLPQTLRKMPELTDLVHFEQAVAGHDGTLSDATGELFIKPATRAESDFYTTSINDHPAFAAFMPTFLGTLSLSSSTNDSIPTTFEEESAALTAAHTPIPFVTSTELDSTTPIITPGAPPASRKITTDQAIVLENAAYGFHRPNILDIKLGVRLWADDAREDKKARFDKITATTTHKSLGFRIAGMRVWESKNDKQTIGEDGYNHKVKRRHTDTYVSNGDSATEDSTTMEQEGAYKIYDKEFGKIGVNDDSVEDALKSFFFPPGIATDLAEMVTSAFLSDLDEIQDVMEHQESRMFSASLLFIFEGDNNALRKAVDSASTGAETSGETKEVIGDGLKADTEEEEEDEDSDGEIEERLPPIYALKVIDFAHAEWVPGQGSDENSLKGIRSVKRILERFVDS